MHRTERVCCELLPVGNDVCGMDIIRYLLTSLPLTSKGSQAHRFAPTAVKVCLVTELNLI